MLMKDCIFCKIANHHGRQYDHETPNFVVFPDIHPSAPTHLLIVPRKHYHDITVAPDELWTEVKHIALALAKKLNVSGFRLALNNGDKVAIEHMHIHFLANFEKDRHV